MVGCFGLSEPHHPRVPNGLLVEANARLDVWHLLQCGALVEGATTDLAIEGDAGTVGGPPAIRAVNIQREGSGVTIDGTCVTLAWDEPMPGVERPWWSCPLCSARARFVYIRGDAIGCRRCLRLDYASRHQRRQTPGVGRVERLRRKLGSCELRPFAPLPASRRGRSQAYHDALVARIHDEEVKLLGHLQTVTGDLERRIEVRKAKRKW